MGSDRRMIKFKEFIAENESATSTDVENKIQELKYFVDELTGYVMYNDEDSQKNLYALLNKYENELKSLKVVKKHKKLFRLVSLYKDSDYKIKKGITSTTKKKYSGDYLEDIKDMIGQYTDTKGKDFYWVTIENVEGFDFNEFGKLFKGKKKYFTSKYDSQGDMTFDVLYDAIKDLKKQNEVILFGDYKVSNIEISE